MTKWVKHFGHTKILTTHLLKQSYTPFYMELKLYFLLNINFFFTQNCYLKKNKQVRRMCVFDFLNQKHFMKIVSRYNKEQNVIKHYFLEFLKKKVRLHLFQVGNLIPVIRRSIITTHKTSGNFLRKWNGPYVVHQVHTNGVYKIVVEDGLKSRPINGKFLKHYYA